MLISNCYLTPKKIIMENCKNMKQINSEKIPKYILDHVKYTYETSTQKIVNIDIDFNGLIKKVEMINRLLKNENT